MALTGNGTTDVVRTTSALAAGPTRYTWHLFYKNAAAPGTALVDKPFSLADSGSTYDLSFCWDHTSTAATYFHRRASGSYDSVSFTGLTNNTYYGLGATYNGTAIQLWLNGATHGSAVASADPPTSPAPTPAALAGSGGTANFDDGTAAELGLWNAALSADEMQALGKGVSPKNVRPTSLLVYWPLIRDPVNYFGGALTFVGLTAATHPRVYHGDGQDNAMYFAADAEVRRALRRYLRLGVRGGLPEGQMRGRSRRRGRMDSGVNVVLTDTVILTENQQADSGYLGQGRAREVCN